MHKLSVILLPNNSCAYANGPLLHAPAGIETAPDFISKQTILLTEPVELGPRITAVFGWVDKLHVAQRNLSVS